MASIPARARKLAALITKMKLPFTYVPADSPGGSHEFHLKTAQGLPFTVLVERDATTVWAPNGIDSTAYQGETRAIYAIIVTHNNN